MTDPVGGVFFLPSDTGGVQPPLAGHPCVVVLAIAGTKEAVVVPGFTAGGITITRTIAAYQRLGIDRGALSVTLDNRHAIAWTETVPAAEQAEWAAFEFGLVPLATLRSARRWGTLKEQPFQAVATALLAFSQTAPGRARLSPHLQKRLRKLKPSSDG